MDGAAAAAAELSSPVGTIQSASFRSLEVILQPKQNPNAAVEKPNKQLCTPRSFEQLPPEAGL
jgi:hypothetical protein